MSACRLEMAFHDWTGSDTVHVWLYTPGVDGADAEVDVRINVFDSSRCGRDVDVSIVDIVGDPDAARWVDEHEHELIELYDESAAKRARWYFEPLEA